MNQLLFYQKPEALNPAKHRSLKITADQPNFSFAAHTNCIPLTAIEFPRATLDFPIVFTGTADSLLSPVAIVGLKNNENIFVDADGRWLASYIPAFVRRYPFVLAEQPNSNELAVFIDSAFSGFTSGEGQQLFVDQDKPSDFLRAALQFLKDFQDQSVRTREFMQELKNLDLLVSRQFQISQHGKTIFTLRDFYVIDESLLAKLSDSQLITLGRRGYLMLIYAHLFSLANTQKVFAHAAEKDFPGGANHAAQ